MVRWLLEKGADPEIKECFGHHDALNYAELCGNEEVAQVLRQSIKDEHNRLFLWSIRAISITSILTKALGAAESDHAYEYVLISTKYHST